MQHSWQAPIQARPRPSLGAFYREVVSAATILDGLLDPLGQCLDIESARRVVELSIAPNVQDRVDWLAARTNEGMLTDDERGEYETLVNAVDLISILKAKARLVLGCHP